MAGGVLATGSYVVYKDHTRFERMSLAYTRGRILPPLAENDYEVAYFRRPELEQTIREVLSPRFTNEYYLISGEAGSGKTRAVVEIIRDMITTEGRRNQGAPIYVQAVQGKSFPETLASAVNFYFDEHISFAFFLDFVMRIHSFPSRDDNNRLVRVLDAVEKSAFKYMIRSGRPIVLVFDGVNSLNSYIPGALEKLQEKAKLWADANIAKVVFISNDEETESVLQKNSSSWARAGTPIVFGDMTRQESIGFLTSHTFMENSTAVESMPVEEAEKIVDLVGGHIHHLIICKRNWISGKPIEVTVSDLMMREREKFVSVSRRPSLWIAVSILRKAPDKTMLLSKLIKETSENTVQRLAKENVIRYGRSQLGTTVQFQTRLTEIVVEELQRAYVVEKRLAKSKVAEAPPNNKGSI